MFSKIRSDFLQRLDVRLTAYYTLIVLLLAAICCSFLYYRLQHNLMKQVHRLLHDEAYELIAEINNELQAGATLVSGCVKFQEDIAGRKFYPLTFRLMSAAGELVWQSPTESWFDFPAIAHQTSYVTIRIAKQAFPYRFYEESFVLASGEQLVVQIGTPLKQLEKTLRNFLNNIFMGVPVLLLLCIGGGVLISRKPRTIMRTITRVTNRITSQNLRERLPVPPARDEVRDLTVTINAMMDRLEKSFAEIKQFSSDVSHELRNPLFALKGEIEVALSHKREAAEYREVLHESLDRINQLIKMVSDLFLITRFDSGKISLERSYLNLVTLVEEMVDFFQPMADQKRVRLQTDLCPRAILSADKSKLAQVLNNLLDNAIKFTPPDGTVFVSLDAGETEICLCVRDSGIGIPVDALENVFNRFYQVDPARSGPGKGAGLGLQICKRIVDAHGGAIAIAQNEGAGITVTVTLPQKQE